MILIITHKEDYTADFLINQLNQQEISYFRLNCEDLLVSPLYEISDKGDFKVFFKEHSEIKSIWYRRTQLPDLKGMNPAEQQYFFQEFEALLENLYHALAHFKWLSDPFRIRMAENKLLQLQKARLIGMNIPRTLITNDKEKLKAFYGQNSQIIIKPLYSGYVPQNGSTSLLFTNLIGEVEMATLDEFDLTPCIYQEYIEKEYELRITVVNGKVFAAKVDSQAHEETKVDWRKIKLQFSACEIPSEVSRQCIELCQTLGINFGAIDLIQDKAGKYWFLEINPNGQWAWIEMDTGLKISASIIQYLTTNL
ncbi:MvdC/MvdD family ATP grasp protein [Mucilaginibacter sp. OK098]|uniref:MvdC/MvdD family ATP grasp protein n=1 Tax=Mucilaginibacter sp. OK098 TaxID=1855297 RepID=UPI000917871E|nr:hypothetical protein [Mucilaginibacter sp. OK098]SHM98612.1 Glutathione synthase/RimK-type ligase, ATP-grasp superfamily [Mucilaginibacter sp. OK098]